MGDEEDRKRLEMMSEKEREEEIFKRAEKREMEKKRFEIEKKLKLQRRKTKEETKQVNKALDTKERSRARKEAVESKRDKKSLALDVLKAKRKEKQELQAKKVRRTAMLLLVTRGMRFSNTNLAIQHYVPNVVFSSDSLFRGEFHLRIVQTISLLPIDLVDLLVKQVVLRRRDFLVGSLLSASA